MFNLPLVKKSCFSSALVKADNIASRYEFHFPFFTEISPSANFIIGKIRYW